MSRKPLAALLLFLVNPVYGQVPDTATRFIARFPFEYTGLLASGPARVGVPLIEEGKRAAAHGDEMGSLDVVIDDVTVVRDFGLRFDAGVVGRSIVARPEGPVVVYSHPTFTVREHIFAALTDPAAFIILEIETVKPLTFSVSGIPRVFTVDSAGSASQFIAFCAGDSAAQRLARVHTYWQEKVAHYRRVLNDNVSIDAADQRVVQAYEWAKVAQDKQLSRLSPGIVNQVAVDSSEVTDSAQTESGASALTADWGVRLKSRDAADYDPLRWDRGAVVTAASAAVALGYYQNHRDWEAFDLIRDLTRETFDFTRGRIPQLLSGAYYQELRSAAPYDLSPSKAFIQAVVEGLVGWHVDAPRHAAALEPHLPAEWPDMSAINLRVGRDRLDATIARESSVFIVNIHRTTSGPPITLRVAPALPLGAVVDRIVVNDVDVPVQSEETAHDIHAVAELRLAGDAQIEVHYSGGVDVLTQPERVDIGETSHELKILDFRRDGRDYVITIEGIAASAYAFQLRSSWRIRSISGSDGFDQSGSRITVRTTMPAGAGFVRKTLRIKADS